MLISPVFDDFFLVFADNFDTYVSDQSRVFLLVFIIKRFPVLFPFLLSTSINSM
jgi:hypothetical protein